MFNLGDYLGRYFQEFTKLGMNKNNSWWYCLLIAIARFSFIWLFLNCNVDGDTTSKTGFGFLNNDLVATFLVLLLGITNGYLCSLSLQFAALQFEPDETTAKAKIGGYSTTILTLGLLAGSLWSYSLVENAKEQQGIAAKNQLEESVVGVLQKCVDSCADIIARGGQKSNDDYGFDY